ncbi:transposase [Mesorhizobium sp.]|uniref:transposase n=1 Tax=Mesorhizobium sp. TaxID=1871066 RepID=UPI0025FEC5D8|nr:transposase [Mesorhizobium sp.]
MPSRIRVSAGDIRRFGDPQRLVAYLGLNPSVRQSGEGPAYHGRITGPRRCAGNARRSGMGGCPLTGSSARLLQADRLASREAHRGRRHCAPACNDHLADAKQGRRLYLGPASLLARKFRSVELRAGLPD